MMKEYIPSEHVYHILRGHLLHYLKGFRGASALRGKAVHVNSPADLNSVLSEAEELLKMEGNYHS